jgi:hypothetical protein
MIKLKKLLAAAIASAFMLTGILPASAASAVPGTETYLFHSSINNGTNTISDTASLKFMGVEAEFDYDISGVAIGTELQFSLELTGSRNFTVGTGCCVSGGIDGVWEEQQVSRGGGVWTHVKAEGEKVANLRIYNRYEEFLDGKYRGLIGKVTASTKVKIGDAAPMPVDSKNSSKYKLTYEFATYARTFTVPKQMTKLWVETMWSPRSQVAKGTVLTYTEPKIAIRNAKTKKTSNFKIVNNGFSLSMMAYNNDTGYFQERKGLKLSVTQAGATVSIGQGIYLPASTPPGSTITVSRFKVTR